MLYVFLRFSVVACSFISLLDEPQTNSAEVSRLLPLHGPHTRVGLALTGEGCGVGCSVGCRGGGSGSGRWEDVWQPRAATPQTCQEKPPPPRPSRSPLSPLPQPQPMALPPPESLRPPLVAATQTPAVRRLRSPVLMLPLLTLLRTELIFETGVGGDAQGHYATTVRANCAGASPGRAIRRW